jgi:hypothetical protein
MAKLIYNIEGVYGKKVYAQKRVAEIRKMKPYKKYREKYKRFVRIRTINYAKSNSLRQQGIVGAKGYRVEVALRKLK